MNIRLKKILNTLMICILSFNIVSLTSVNAIDTKESYNVTQRKYVEMYINDHKLIYENFKNKENQTFKDLSAEVQDFIKALRSKGAIDIVRVDSYNKQINHLWITDEELTNQATNLYIGIYPDYSSIQYRMNEDRYNLSTLTFSGKYIPSGWIEYDVNNSYQYYVLNYSPKDWDREVPELSIVQSKYNTQDESTITYEAYDTEDGTGIDYIELPNGEEVYDEDNDGIIQGEYTINASNTYTFKAYDKYGNETIQTIEGEIDTTAPTIILEEIQDGVIGFTVTDTQSKVKEIKLPDETIIENEKNEDVITGEFKTNKSGTYSFTTIDNVDNVLTETIQIEVPVPKYNVEIDTNTSDIGIINLVVINEDNKLEKVELPDGTIVTPANIGDDIEINYKVSESGTYIFRAYNNSGAVTEISATVNLTQSDDVTDSENKDDINSGSNGTDKEDISTENPNKKPLVNNSDNNSNKEDISTENATEKLPYTSGMSIYIYLIALLTISLGMALIIFEKNKSKK